MALSKKGTVGYKHCLPNVDSPNKVMTAAGISQHPPLEGWWIPPEDSPDWAQSFYPRSGAAVQHPDGGIREHSLPTTLGRLAQDSPHHVPSPWTGKQRLLKRQGSSSPSATQEATPPLLPLTGTSSGISVWSFCTSAGQ